MHCLVQTQVNTRKLGLGLLEDIWTFMPMISVCKLLTSPVNEEITLSTNHSNVLQVFILHNIKKVITKP